MTDSPFDGQEGDGSYYHHQDEHDHHDHDEDHHVPLWILALIGSVVAILIVLPNILVLKRPDKTD